MQDEFTLLFYIIFCSSLLSTVSICVSVGVCVYMCVCVRVCVQLLVPQEEEKVFIVASPECLREIYWGGQTPGQSLQSVQEVDGEHNW